jgi:hypothetical protein
MRLDENLRREMTDHLVETYRRGREAELVVFDGVGHAFASIGSRGGRLHRPDESLHRGSARRWRSLRHRVGVPGPG